MLESIYIENFAIIDRLEVDFLNHMTVLTGETGAGKSIIIDAIGQLMGNRSQTSFIKAGKDECFIEGVFTIAKNSPVLAKLKELNYQIGGFNAFITSDVIMGAGLSSSAAFETIIGTILSGLYNDMTVDPVLIAQIGQYAENVYFGKPCGLMDQCASSVGSLINIDFKDIAEDTAGFTGAELANILNEAAIIATTNKHKSINRDDIEEAIKKVTVGLEKHSRVISDKDKKLTAYHEAGHAVVSRYLETQNDIKEVSIIPRGVAGGYTMYKTNEDKYYISKTEMEEKLVALLGGRAAEKLVLDDISTGASNDLEVATNIARDMITVYGMSDTIGPISLKDSENPNQMILYGEKMQDAIGAEIKILIDTAYRNAQKLLIEHRDKLDAVANVLLQKEKITEKEFYEIFND